MAVQDAVQPIAGLGALVDQAAAMGDQAPQRQRAGSSRPTI